MSQEFLPIINVIASPTKVSRGQMISINASIVEKTTLKPMVFDTIYMEILDSKGVVVWPLSTIEKNSSTISKLISTAEMKRGKYTVRITPSKYRTPIGVARFEIEDTDMTLIPLIPLALLAIPSSSSREKIEKEFVEPPVIPKIAWLIYRTEKDSKVCEICRPHEGKVFRPDDPKLIRISPPELGGDTHYRCRCHYDIITQEQERRRLNAEYELQAEQAYNAYMVAKAFWQTLKITNPTRNQR